MKDINDLNGRDLYGEIISAHLEQRSKGREPDSFARLLVPLRLRVLDIIPLSQVAYI